MDAKKVLVLTYKPQVEFGWAEDLKTHVDFDGWEYFYAKDFGTASTIDLPGEATTEVLFASFQDLNDMSKTKWKNIAKYNFDLLIIDEQHYGLSTPKAQKTLESLSFNRILEVSGTPLHALMSGKFLDEEIYSWTYADEQRCRRIEQESGWASEIYRWLPSMKFMVFEVSDEAKTLTASYTEDEGFTMQKMFGSEDGETFIDQSAVTLWLEAAYGIKGHKTQSPVRQYNSDHMVWKLPSVNACRAMEKLLASKEYVKHVPVVVSGTQGASLIDVKNSIQRFDKTVTLTCGSLMTGTTVPQWDVIFMLDGGVSPQDYFQTIFRVQSSNQSAGKEQCVVVDYNPQRNLEMIYEYAIILSQPTRNTPREMITEFLDFAPVLDHTGNKPVPIDVEHIIEAVAHNTNIIEKFGCYKNFQFNNVTDDIVSLLQHIDADVNSNRTIEVNNNGLRMGNNRSGPITPTTKNAPVIDMSEKVKDDIRQRAITMIKRLPNYIWLSGSKAENLEELLTAPDTDTFINEVGISPADLQTLYDSNFLNTQRVNLCIMSYQLTQRKLFPELTTSQPI
jgi:superfamily II DNA or RNA helicase